MVIIIIVHKNNLNKMQSYLRWMLIRALMAALIFYVLLQQADASIYSNCIICHDPQGLLGGKLQIDSGAFGQSVHGKINTQNVPSIFLSSAGCWACHDSDGIVLADADGMGDRYKNPFICTDCHLRGGEKEGAYGAPLINSHFAGGILKAGLNNISSCISCHEIPRMVLDNTDTDTGTFAGDNERENGGNLSYYHYGKRRQDLESKRGTTEYCSYCHSLQSEFAGVFQRSENRNILNHSLRFPPPACSECHGNNGSLHSPNLEKPPVSDTLCLGCHAAGRFTGPKSRHNGTVNCTTCHGGVHPVTYIQQNGTYGFIPANCPQCHEQGLIGAPIIPPLQHSDNPNNGSIFGNYWDTKVEACRYCHGNTLHAEKAFGKIANIQKSQRNTTNFNSFWCSNCHYNAAPFGEYFYNVTTFVPVPPEITNPGFFNHSALITSDWSDAFCKNCHGKLILKNTTVEFAHRVSQGPGGPDCVRCHDIGGFAPKRVDFSAFKEGVHRNLNSNATNSTALSETVDKACWACHGEGIEPEGHPQRYKNPRRCQDNECHSLSQSFKAPMLYSHFKDADLNDNPSDALNYNISTKVSCEACHSNSLTASAENTNASVSHYASGENLIDSTNCIYCHLDEDNALKWGNATLINKNTTSMVEINREKNKFTASVGDFVELGNGYRIKVTDISAKRGSAFIELYKLNNLVDSGTVNTGQYIYEENRIINNASFKTPAIELNITGIFLKDNGSIMQFEGLRIKRLHYENKTTSCYICHFSGDLQKRKYMVIDRRNDYLFYAEVFFNSSDKKEYEQEQALATLSNITPKDAFASIERAKRKTLRAGEKWALSGNYTLTLEEVASDSDSARFLLEAGGKSYSDVARKGEELDFELNTNYLGYQFRNITIFRANVSEISQGNPNIAVLEDIFALSPEINKIKDNESIFGYNTSWLWENNTFITGRIPTSMHAPLLQDGANGGSDCLFCHGSGGIVQKGTISLGKHAALNGGRNRACYACHGGSESIKNHPANYRMPRNCVSCHASTKDNYSATYIGDEEHKNERCEACHVSDTHNIIVFRLGLLPSVTNISLLKQENRTIVKAFAVAGYKMKVRDARYYIDSPDRKIKMYPSDGAFDSQEEGIFAEINTSNLSPGKHAVYVEAMERNNRWGAPASIVFTAEGAEMKDSKKLSSGLLPLLGILAAILVRKFT